MNIKDIEIIKHKVKGKTNRQIAKIVYPNQKPTSGAVSVSRKLSKANVQTELQAELKRQGITLKKALAPIKDALGATKYATVEGDFYNTELPEHTTRLQASRMALDLLDKSPPQTSIVNTEALTRALGTGDERLLLGVVFPANPPTQTGSILVENEGIEDSVTEQD